MLYTCVPMKERLPTEHSSEGGSNPLEQFLDSGGVPDERCCHLQAAGRDVADGSLDIVRDPFDKVGRVLVLNTQQLFVHLLHGHPAAEDRGNGQVAAVGRVAGGHHVLGVKHLLGQLGNGQ